MQTHALTVLIGGLVLQTSQIHAQFEGFANRGLAGVGRLPADSFDRLGPNVDTLGGIFSAMSFDQSTWAKAESSNGPVYSGVLYSLPDRGFGDGAQDFHPRIQTFALEIAPYYGPGPVAQTQITFSNTATLLLRDGTNFFTGFDPSDPAATAYPQSAAQSLGQGRRSLDPEGMVRTRDGGFFVSDEYGPFIYRFDSNGLLQATFQPPAAVIPKRGKFPGTTAFSATNNLTSGRRSNRGLEGLGMTPDERKLIAILQSPAIQDGGASNSSRNTRILIFDIQGGSPTYGKTIAEYVYYLTLNGTAQTNRQTVAGELFALNHHQFLILERDSMGLGAGAPSPFYKSVVLADISAATNIVNTGYDLELGAPFQTSLPTSAVSSEVAPVLRQELVAIVDTNQLAKFGLNIQTNQDSNTLTEKWEGLGVVPLNDPAAPDDYLLLIGNDNDFKAPNVYHNGVIVGTNNPTVDMMLLAYRVALPTLGAPAPSNQPPSVVFTGPTNATLSAPATVLLSAHPYDQDGLVTKVEFFQGNAKLGEADTFPFTLSISNVAAGNYEVVAVATDHEGATNATPAKTIVVTSENLLPLVSVAVPTNHTLSAPATVLLTASAADPDGTVTKVEFFDGNLKLGERLAPPYQLTVTNVGAGIHDYAAAATDNQGATNRSVTAPMTVTVENILPAVSIVSPTNGTVLAAPATLVMRANAADEDGTIAKVEFYLNGAKVGEDLTSPYSLTLNNQAVGSFIFTAVAIDNQGASNRSQEVSFRVDRAVTGPLLLQILHASDFESDLGALDDAARFSSVLRGLKASYPGNSVVLSSGGNYSPGPFFTASADPAAPFKGIKGAADMVLMNSFGIQASALGNQEFEDGTAALGALARANPSANYPGTLFPYLSANLDISPDRNLASLVAADGQDVGKVTNKITRSSVITVGGEKIGVVGATTTDLRAISSPGAVEVSTNLVATIQAAVDALLAQGINKIILLAHLRQLTNEFTLAGQLRDVDVIIAGGSNTLLAKDSDRLRAGDTRQGDYPAAVASTTGEPVYLVNMEGNYRYVGRLVVQFDPAGVITNVDSRSGAYATDAQGVIDTGNSAPHPAIPPLMNTLAGIIDTKDGNRSGRTAVYLNGLPDEVESEETNLGDLTADANLARGRLADPATSISFKNGGGIGDSIGAIRDEGGVLSRVPPLPNPRVGKTNGEVSQLDIENALRFNDGLVLLTITAQQLRDALEWGVSGSGAPGQFPQVGGLAFAFDSSRTPMTLTRDTNNVPTGIASTGERVRSLVVRTANGGLDLLVENGKMVGNTNRVFRMVTLDFLANGGDSYYPLTLATNRLDLIETNVAVKTWQTPGTEQKALADYLAAIQVYRQRDEGPELDRRMQILSRRTDTVLSPEVVAFRATEAGVTLSFSTLPGKSYVVQSAPEVTGPWANLSGTALTGDGQVKTFAEPAPTARAFYRILLSN